MKLDIDVLVEVTDTGYVVIGNGVTQYKFGEMLVNLMNCDLSHLKEYILQSKYLNYPYKGNKAVDMILDFGKYLYKHYDRMTAIQIRMAFYNSLNAETFKMYLSNPTFYEDPTEILEGTPYEEMGRDYLGQFYLSSVCVFLRYYHTSQKYFKDYVETQDDEKLPKILEDMITYEFGPSYLQSAKAYLTLYDHNFRFVYEINEIAELMIFEIYHCKKNNVKFGYDEKTNKYYILSDEEKLKNKN